MGLAPCGVAPLLSHAALWPGVDGLPSWEPGSTAAWEAGTAVPPSLHPNAPAPHPTQPPPPASLHPGANVTFKQFLVSNLIPVTLGNIVAGTVRGSCCGGWGWGGWGV